MKSITKKRWAAVMIDTAVSTAISFGAEYFVRKKIKNEAVNSFVIPTAIMWGLEYIQLKSCGQTLGYKTMGLALENGDGTKPTDAQIAKRILYRDTISTFDYLKDRHEFEGEDGSALPHDRFAGTVVKEV